MCATCGCNGDDGESGSAGTRLTLLEPHQHPDDAHPHDHPHPHGHSHDHADDHAHDHAHPHDHPHPHVNDSHGHSARHDHPQAPANDQRPKIRSLEQDLLAKNDQLALANREQLRQRSAAAVNLMSSPGSGKTTLLVRTLTDLAGTLPVVVVEGDQETLLDAERIHATGAPVVQINTGAACHLDAEMMAGAMAELDVRNGSLVFVENVGNLVCPAAFDLGETARVVVISVTEGHDKPLKYPQMFAAADLVLINKADLLPYVDFDVDTCIEHARRVRPGVPSLLVSATRGDGLEDWYAWLTGIRSDAAAPSVEGQSATFIDPRPREA